VSAIILEGDCLDIMPTLASASVDAIICDLPYGVTNCKWDSVIPFAPMWEQLKRIAKPRAAIVLFASQPFTSALVMSNPAWFRYTDVWDKRLPVGHLNAKYRPLRQHEDICVFSKGTLGNFTYNPQMRTGVLRDKGGYQHSECYGAQRSVKIVNDQYHPTSLISIARVQPGTNDHPTQKPQALLSYLVRTYTNPGDIVLDFAMGSGTTGAACIENRRGFIGIEKERKYYNIARRRLTDAAATQQPALFAAD
jgi:site-specific DNA-methyltransferase (adenine-specific)